MRKMRSTFITEIYNCHECDTIIIGEVMEYEGNYFLSCTCDNCNKKDPLSELLIFEVPLSTTVRIGLNDNVKRGFMVKRPSENNQEWKYKLTKKGKDHAEKMVRRAQKYNKDAE